MSILEARAQAQKLAFGPIVFQAVRLAWKSGLLKTIEHAGDRGADCATLARETGLSDYGVGVLLEVTCSADLTCEVDERFQLTKIGSIFLHDKLTQVNVDFVHDVCYQGMHHLEASIATGKPVGLSVFSNAETIYQCVTELPDAAQKSWYDFDHYYSDRSFREAVEIVFSRPVHQLLDVGGNTGRWATRCLERDTHVHVTIADLPGQLDRARVLLDRTPHSARLCYHEVDILDRAAELPGTFDVIWMSQFLDCFAEAEIARILEIVKPSLTGDGRLYIMETLVDRQQFDAATYSLNAISLYFTAMANGRSRMYRGTTLERILEDSGFEVIAFHDGIGLGHTLLECVTA